MRGDTGRALHYTVNFCKPREGRRGPSVPVGSGEAQHWRRHRACGRAGVPRSDTAGGGRRGSDQAAPPAANSGEVVSAAAGGGIVLDLVGLGRLPSLWTRSPTSPWAQLCSLAGSPSQVYTLIPCHSPALCFSKLCKTRSWAQAGTPRRQGP